MRRILFSFLLLFAASVFAQDVIVKKDGTTIICKVLEVGKTEVKYKKYSNQDGPTYTITWSEIQAINYENGEKETSNDGVVTHPQEEYNVYSFNNPVDVLSSQKKYQKEKLLLSAKHWRTTRYAVGTTLAVASIGASFFLWDNKTALGIVVGLGIGGGILFAGICGQTAKNKVEQAEAIASSMFFKKDFYIGNSLLSAGPSLLSDKMHNNYALGLGLRYNF